MMSDEEVIQQKREQYGGFTFDQLHDEYATQFMALREAWRSGMTDSVKDCLLSIDAVTSLIRERI